MAKGQAQADVQMVSDGPEFRFIGHLLGTLIASAGLLAGTMMQERSFDYWLEDIVPLVLLAITLRGLLLNAVELAKISIIHGEKMDMLLQSMAREQVLASQQPTLDVEELAHLPTKKHHYSEEEVLEAVSKRLQEKKDDAMRQNKSAPQ